MENAGVNSCAASVTKLEELLANKYITQAEFEQRRQALLDQFRAAAAEAKEAAATQGPPPPQAGAGSAYAAVVPSIMTPTRCVKLRGLPFGATVSDVQDFFSSYQLDPVTPVGFLPGSKQSGVCYVKLISVEEARKAQAGLNNTYMGSRYVEMFPTPEDEMNHATAQGQPAFWLRMRGLPFGASKEDITTFFSDLEVPSSNVVTFERGSGKPQGEAFVQFNSELEVQRALLKDRQSMGHRYIELFSASADEVDRAVRGLAGGRGKRSGSPGFGAAFGSMASSYTNEVYGSAVTPESEESIGGSKLGLDNVVRLRGMPFKATETDLQQFFQGIDVTQDGLHMIYSDGRPSGEAFAEFRFRHGAEEALRRNRKMMHTRYIEVYPSSRSEMMTKVNQSRMHMMHAGGFAAAVASPGAPPIHNTIGLGYPHMDPAYHAPPQAAPAIYPPPQSFSTVAAPPPGNPFPTPTMDYGGFPTQTVAPDALPRVAPTAPPSTSWSQTTPSLTPLAGFT